MGKEEAHDQMEWAKAQEVLFSVDLMKAAKQQLQFLAAVETFNCLYDGPALCHAVHRYEHCWLPLLAKYAESPNKMESIVVPLDCEWIWHCHRLNPVQYKIDCEEIYGCFLDNKNVHSTTEGIATRQTEIFWNNMYPKEQYNFNQILRTLASAKYADMEPQTKIKYDLVAAVKRQCSFFNKVSKVIIDDDHYLGEAVARYKAFLHLVKRNEDESVKSFVPALDIDLIWHSHQLNPHAYCEDIRAICGKIVNHDDNDMSEDPSEDKFKFGRDQTKRLWEDTYDRIYMTAGSMFKALCGTCVSQCQALCSIGVVAY